MDIVRTTPVREGCEKGVRGVLEGREKGVRGA